MKLKLFFTENLALQPWSEFIVWNRSDGIPYRTFCVPQKKDNHIDTFGPQSEFTCKYDHFYERYYS